MKKILIYTLLSLTVFAGCKKDNDNLIDGQRPEERVTKSLNEYNDMLTGSTYGWKAYLYPDEGNGGGYSFYMNFNKENRVTMLADLGFESTALSRESSYRLKANQIPSLLFDTYNYMHVLADPDDSVYGGDSGWGRYSDFEFSFDKVAGDSVKMTGKLLKSRLLLVKATKADQEAYNAGTLLTTFTGITDFVNAYPYYYILLGDENKLQTSFNFSSKVFSITYINNGVVETLKTPFTVTLIGIHLREPIIYNGKSFSDFVFDPETGGLYATVEGVKIVVQTTGNPILPLHNVIGINYNSIIVPAATNSPGWSPNFVARRAAAAAGIFNNYSIVLGRMVFDFNTDAKLMTMTAAIPQNGNPLVAVYSFAYTKTSAGVYKFTAAALTGNASAMGSLMAPITTQRLNVDNFILDYYINPANGQVLGQFKSVEHPDFFFSGTLQ